ncbi:MAG: DUF4124 domain-containing protein [Pseudomonadota bacterium]
MRIIALLSGLLLFAALASAQQVYRWVDENGVVHYSDQPPADQSEADLVDVDGGSSFTAPTPAPPVRRPQRTTPNNGGIDVQLPDDDQGQIYEQVIIESPESQQVLWNIATRLPVRVNVEPALALGDQIQWKLDGQAIGSPQTLNQTVLTPVYRGEHRLEAEIIGEDGEVKFRSPATVFYVQQTTIN